jgi:hypothetical protein
MITGTGTGPMRPCPHFCEQQRRAAEHRHAAERHDERRHPQLGDRHALDQPAGETDGEGRHQRQLPAITHRFRAGADAEAVGEPALGHGRRRQAREGQQRPDRKVDSRRQDDERHAHRQQAVDRDLSHDVEQIYPAEELRLGDGEPRHQHEQKDERRKTREHPDHIDRVPRSRHRPCLALYLGHCVPMQSNVGATPCGRPSIVRRPEGGHAGPPLQCARHHAAFRPRSVIIAISVS